MGWRGYLCPRQRSDNIRTNMHFLLTATCSDRWGFCKVMTNSRWEEKFAFTLTRKTHFWTPHIEANKFWKRIRSKINVPKPIRVSTSLPLFPFSHLRCLFFDVYNERWTLLFEVLRVFPSEISLLPHEIFCRNRHSMFASYMPHVRRATEKAVITTCVKLSVKPCSLVLGQLTWKKERKHRFLLFFRTFKFIFLNFFPHGGL
jgi:hypothetical protein